MLYNLFIWIAENPTEGRSIGDGRDNAHEHIDPGIRLGDSTVKLSAAKQLAAPRDRPFASLRVTVEVPLYRAHRRCIGPNRH
jgi:hypothetical protein